MLGNTHIEMNPTETRAYILNLRVFLHHFISQKNTVEQTLRRLEPVWMDAVFKQSWNTVIKISEKIKLVYDGSTRAIQSAANFYDEYAKYNEKVSRSINKISVEPYDITLRRMDEMSNEYREISDVDEMTRFIRQMETYIQETKNTVTKISSAHESAGRYWKSKQYDELTQILYEVKSEIKRELFRLESLNALVKKKRDYLVQVASQGIRR